MLFELKANDHKIGWHGITSEDLLEHIDDELAEIKQAVNVHDGTIESTEDIIAECADLANLVMFLADNAHGQFADFAEKPGEEG
jgi:NTP pyrophosphatase (non-canonical NTP hydrolase)